MRCLGGLQNQYIAISNVDEICFFKTCFVELTTVDMKLPFLFVWIFQFIMQEKGGVIQTPGEHNYSVYEANRNIIMTTEFLKKTRWGLDASLKTLLCKTYCLLNPKK
jgi:hypothetical protein